MYTEPEVTGDMPNFCYLYDTTCSIWMIEENVPKAVIMHVVNNSIYNIPSGRHKAVVRHLERASYGKSSWNDSNCQFLIYTKQLDDIWRQKYYILAKKRFIEYIYTDRI